MNYLYDADEVERLALEYGMPGSTEATERIEGQIVEETVGAIYPDRVPEDMDFPTGTALLVALIKLHRETDDADVIDYIEREIEVVRDGVVNAAAFDVKPLPYAAYSDLLAHADRFEGREEAVCRYFRLRAFEGLGAFDDVGLLRARGGEGRPVEGLTDEERAYLEGL